MAHSPKEILQKYWGYDSFRPMQEEVIDSIMQGNDTLVLFPTGGGKSICYQVPALAMEGLCLVVSPLISLMKDQVQNLSNKGIKAACLVAGTNSLEQEVIFNNCIFGKTKILYVSPERLTQQVFIQHFRQMKVSMIAVDEAHCISQWGYDFRPAYLGIARIRDYHPSAPIMALTATATQEVVVDIQKQLLFRNGKRVYQSSFTRNNLAYMVFAEENKDGRLIRIINKVGGSGIVYVRNRRRTRAIADMLIQHGISATYYHAGLEAKERDLAQLRWMKGEVDVIVATNAFGMGIDKPNVRYVVHMDIPSSIEAYFQEAGRAGRDGKKAYAVLLYNQDDLGVLDANIEASYPSRQIISNTYRAICNYYQIPIGAGEDCQFDFDLEGICNTYHFNVVEFYNAARFLEKEGLVVLPDREDAESKLYIPIDRETLYRFQIDQPRYSDLLVMILRLYGGLFTSFVPISEKLLARQMYMNADQIRNMLLHLDALKIVKYQPQKTKKQIIFPVPRIDAKDISLTDSNYRNLKENASIKKDAIRNYVVNTQLCRSEMLLAYFGEQQSDPCQQCDHCIVNKKQTPTQELRNEILGLLKKKPMNSNELLSEIAHIDESRCREELRQLVDEGLVGINKQLQFFV